MTNRNNRIAARILMTPLVSAAFVALAIFLFGTSCRVDGCENWIIVPFAAGCLGALAIWLLDDVAGNDHRIWRFLLIGASLGGWLSVPKWFAFEPLKFSACAVLACGFAYLLWRITAPPRRRRVVRAPAGHVIK